MSFHVRKQLRDQVATLITTLPTYTTFVFKNRKYPLDSTELPALIVQTGNEEIEVLTTNYPAQQLRKEQLIISVIVENVFEIDDIIDTICKEIEQALAGNVTVSRNFSLLGTSAIEPNVIGEKPVCTVDMQYMAEIVTLENAPDVSL